MSSGEDGDMTLAFSLSAAEGLAVPVDAFTDAGVWSQHVGIVSEDRRATERYIRNHGLTQDFFTGEYNKAENLMLINRQYESDRYVYLGTTEDDRQAANAAGWEYLPIEDAAAQADWKLAPTDGVVAQFSRFLKNRWYPFLLSGSG